MKHFKLFFLALVLALTANTFSQWTFVGFVTGAGGFPMISTVDPNTAWIAGGIGGSPRVFRTTNAGVNWVNVTGNLTGPEYFAVWGVDANTCVVGDGGSNGGAGGNARLWRTTNGGVLWTNVLTTGGTLGFFNGLAGDPGNRNFIWGQSDAPTGAAWFGCTSTNGGATWTTFTQTTTGGGIGAAGSIFCVNNMIYGNGMSTVPRVVFTTNGGSTWLSTLLSVAGTFTSGAAANTGAAVVLGATSTSLPNISRSVNQGTSYTTTPVTGTIGGICVISWCPGTNGFYLTGATGTNPMRKSVDGGATWASMTTSGIIGFNHISVINSGGLAHGYAIATDGSICKLSNDPVGVTPINSEVPSAFSLEQNYPNPFNPSTTVKYSVPKASNVMLKVYNSMGQEVLTVVNEYHGVGNYQALVDMGDLSSGIYFYTILADNFKETKKMMLVK